MKKYKKGQRVIIVSGYNYGLDNTYLIGTIGTIEFIGKSDVLVATISGDWYYHMSDIQPLGELGEAIYED